MSLKNLALLVFTSALILSGCGGDKPPEQPVAKRLAFTVQPSQTVAGVVMAPAVQVTVQSAEGTPIPGAQVTVSLALEANPAGGTLSGTTSAATSQGAATFSDLVLDKAGAGYTLVARAQGLESATSQAFTVTAAPVLANVLSFLQEPGELEAGSTFPSVVRVAVRDTAGNPVTASVPVTLALGANPAGGTLSGNVTANTTDGVAAFPELSIDKVGEGYTLVVSAAGSESVTSAAFRVKPGKAKSIAFVTQPASAAVDVALAPAVQVRLLDARGNAATGATDNITLALGTNTTGATLGGTVTVAAVDGVATFADLFVNRVGTYTLAASVAGLDGATSQAFDITAGPATRLAFSAQPTSAMAGSTLTPEVEVTALDAQGNVASFTGAVTVALAANPTGDTLQGTLTVNAVAGVARFSTLSMRRVGTGYTLAASATGLTPATSAAFNVTPGEARALAFTIQPTTRASGTAFSPAIAVSVQDALGNTVTSSTATVQIALGNNPSGASLAGALSVVAVNGVASFPGVSVNLTGTGYTLAASGAGLDGATSEAFNITAGPATRLAFGVQPSNVVAGSAITPAMTVRVVDAAGNTVTAVTPSITVAFGNNPGVGILNGTRTVSAVAGVATFSNLSITRTGVGYTLTAAATGLTTGTSAAFNVTPGAAASLDFFTNAPNTVPAGAVITPAVRVGVRDSYGNTVTTSAAAITLSLAANPGGSTLGGTLTVNAVDGVAVFPDLTLNRSAFNYRFGAASPGITSTTSALFNVAAGAANRLAFTSQPADVAAGATFSTSVRVTVQDALGNTVTTPAVSVSMAIGNNPGSATLGGTTTATTSNGVATFANLNLDRVGTGYTLVASSGVLTAATSNAFNVIAGPATQLAFTVQPGNTSAGAPFDPVVQVSVRDARGNTVLNATTSITLGFGNNPGGGPLSGTTVVSALNGVATFTGVFPTRTGTGYTLRASATGLTAATSAAFNVTAGAASRLAFTVQPSRVFVGAAISPAVQVAVQDSFGNVLTSATDSITLALGNNPSGATLSGTLTVSATNGVASFSDLILSATGAGYRLTASAEGLTEATSAAFDVVIAGTRLVYTAPAPGRRIALVSNPASTATTVVLDLVAVEALTGYSVGMNLPLDAERVQMAGSLMIPGTVLPAGVNPTAAYGALPTSGPLAGVLTTGQSQKAAGEGAVATDSSIAAGTVLYTVQLALRPGAVTGVVFDGEELGPKFNALLRDRLGTDVVNGGGFAIGRLEVQ